MNKNVIAPLAALIAVSVPTWAHAEGHAKAEETWADRISIKGDIRLRQEGIDEEGEENRNRGRYRVRLGLSAKVSEDVKVVVQLASGADSPVSRNVTFDGGFDVDDIGFDLAYVDWTFADGWNFYGGKMKNPLFRAGGAPLIWDGDLNPEGLAVKYSKGALFANAALFSAEERSSDDDSLLTSIQVGGKFKIADNMKLTAGVGYFGYSDTIGNSPFYNGSSKGNSVDIDGNYIYEYKNTEVFAELSTSVGDWPLKVYAQWVQNSEVSEEDTGYAFGAKLGSAKDKGQTEFGWTYQDVEADSVIATFNDSDFGGGGTDASGHILKAKYAVANGIALSGTYFSNEIDRFQGTERDYTRFQLDLQFSFK